MRSQEKENFLWHMNTKIPLNMNKLPLKPLVAPILATSGQNKERKRGRDVGGWSSCSRLFNNLPNWLHLNFTRPLNIIYECCFLFRSPTTMSPPPHTVSNIPCNFMRIYSLTVVRRPSRSLGILVFLERWCCWGALCCRGGWRTNCPVPHRLLLIIIPLLILA